MALAGRSRLVAPVAALALAACHRPGPPPSASANTAPPTAPAAPTGASPEPRTSDAPKNAQALRTGNMDNFESLKLGPAKRRIVTVTTALKPGGPSEVIEANETDEGAELRVRRLHQDDRVEAQTVELTASELAELWRLVDSEKLTSAAPPATDPSIMDGAGHIVVLEWPEAGHTRVHAFHFENPKRESPGLDRLFRRMAELARAKAGSVKLYYYP